MKAFRMANHFIKKKVLSFAILDFINLALCFIFRQWVDPACKGVKGMNPFSLILFLFIRFNPFSFFLAFFCSSLLKKNVIGCFQLLLGHEIKCINIKTSVLTIIGAVDFFYVLIFYLFYGNVTSRSWFLTFFKKRLYHHEPGRNFNTVNYLKKLLHRKYYRMT